MFESRDRIIYIPYPMRGNKVNESQMEAVHILRKRYQVDGELDSWLNVRKMLKTKAIILNWVEERLDKKMKGKLLLSQLFGAKVIWVFHNKQPHDAQLKSKAAGNMKWLADHCDVIWLYSKNSKRYIPNRRKNQVKSIYIPHIMIENRMDDINLEEIRKKYGVETKDFVFTIFGLIRPYKKIEKGIEAFNKLNLPNAKLMIVGPPINASYAKQISQLSADNKDIILDFRYVSNMLLNGIIGISDVVILPYQNESSMNSTVMIQAFSNGKTVISPDMCMARDFVKEQFFYGYRNSLEKVMKKAYINGKEVNQRMGEMAKAYIRENHNKEIVSEKLYSMLET